MGRVFLSYSNLDKELAVGIRDWLVAQGFEAPFLDFDKHSGIPPGSQWERVLYNEIRRSQALLILQTSNWNASKWCFAEFTHARALGKPIFQVIDGDEHSEISLVANDLQYLDLRQERQASLASLQRQLVQIAEQDQGGFPWPPPGDPDRAPYPGLMVFEEEDAPVFFGRDDDWRAVIEKLNSLLIQGSSRLLVIQGASGSGKSSLLRAGVLPRLRRAGRKWIILPPFTPQLKPLENLVKSWSIALGQPNEWRKLYTNLSSIRDPVLAATLLKDWAKDLQMNSNSLNSQVLVSIDQTEELFTLAGKDERNLFASTLSNALADPSPIRALITIRSDTVGILQNMPDFTNIIELLPLSPIPIERYRDVIQGPAKIAGIKVEDALVDKAIRDTETEDALPLLAFALRRLYDTSDRIRGLTLSGYQEMSDLENGLSPLENSLRSQAERVVKVHQPSLAEKSALRDAFVPSMVRVSGQGNFTRRVALWSDLPKESYRMLDALVKERLLIKGQNSEDQTTIEVAHEALFRVWPELCEMLKDEQEFVWSVQQLEQDCNLWSGSPDEKKVDALLTGLKLSRGRVWLA